jgi:chromosome segregation ATPase
MSEKIDRIKERINEIKKEKEELRQKHDYIIEQVKKTGDKNSQEIGLLKGELQIAQEKLERKDDTLTNIRSFMSSLEKAIASVESKQIALKNKSEEDIKLIGREINAQLTERSKAISATLSSQLKDTMDKNLKDTQALKESIRKTIERNEEYAKNIAKLCNDVNLLNKSISELSGRQDALKSGINERMNLVEKELMSEVAKAKALEARLTKDVKDFEKFADEQKAKIEEFEMSVAGKLDMFSVKKENLKRDFGSLMNEFKNVAGRLDSMKEKDSYFDHRLKNVELGLENLKKISEENFAKFAEENKIFKENLVAKLNEASDKIIARLSLGEAKTSSDLAKKSEEIKVFRAHMTQFINDFVNNYEQRFEKMKTDIDQAIGMFEERETERSKQPRAMIFE